MIGKGEGNIEPKKGKKGDWNKQKRKQRKSDGKEKRVKKQAEKVEAGKEEIQRNKNRET